MAAPADANHALSGLAGMLPLPRVAIGTVQPEADLRVILWALMEAFREEGLQVQSFLSQACFARYQGTATATGLNPRHLDSWLMSRELCRELFLRGAESCDLAVVEGKFAEALAEVNGGGGSLDTLCRWLELPRLVVLDVAGMGSCGLPERPAQIDALLLDRVADDRHLADLTRRLESLWGVPVLGALDAVPELRAGVDAACAGNRPSRGLCQQLGSRFRRYGQPQRVLELGFRRELTWVPAAASLPLPGAGELPMPRAGPVVVAVGYDDALNCYFPDLLDLLEARGVTIVDFSPLRDERLPEETAVVYLGCGHPERYAAELSQNHCMNLALRNHLRNGGRIYAEGGGLAYLCQQIELIEGDFHRMTGIFPAVARLVRTAEPPTPVEVTLDRETWLGPRGTRLRGYRNPGWQLEPVGTLTGCVVEPAHRYDLVTSTGAVGSRLHLNFAADAALWPRFFQPHLPRPDSVDPWAVAQ